jgi:hypothetical protein
LRLFGASADIAHLLSKYPQGTPDRVWIPDLAREGGWVVVTSDGGKQSKKSEKLPLICHAHYVTHVVLSVGLHKKKAHDKFLAISECWDELIAATAAADGTGYSRRLTGSGIVRMVNVYDPPDSGPVLQKEMFDA